MLVDCRCRIGKLINVTSTHQPYSPSSAFLLTIHPALCVQPHIPSPVVVPALQATHAQPLSGDQQPCAHHVLRTAAGSRCGRAGGLQVAPVG